MRIVVLTTGSPADAHVVRAVCQTWPQTQVFRPVAGPDVPVRGRRNWGKLVRQPGAVLSSVLREVVRGWWNRRVDATVREHLGAPSLTNVVEIPLSHVRDGTFARRLRAHRPDVCVVAGGPLLRPEVFEAPRLGTINVHHGIAHAYRGECCLFFTICNSDWKRLGVTIHFIDRHIDTGPVLSHGYVALAPGDSEGALLAKYGDIAAREVRAVLRAMERGAVVGVPQERRGALTNYRDWRALLLLRTLFRHHVLRNRPPTRPEAVKRWFHAAKQPTGSYSNPQARFTRRNT